MSNVIRVTTTTDPRPVRRFFTAVSAGCLVTQNRAVL